LFYQSAKFFAQKNSILTTNIIQKQKVFILELSLKYSGCTFTNNDLLIFVWMHWIHKLHNAHAFVLE